VIITGMPTIRTITGITSIATEIVIITIAEAKA
jgi:hypothetical protein